MARGREGIGKRIREKRRIEAKEAKQRRREAFAAEPSGPGPKEEARLMEQFRLLSERHAEGLVTEAAFNAERQRIFAELGIDSDTA